jgi:hypothetical protein
MWQWAERHYDHQQHRSVVKLLDDPATRDGWHWLIQLHHALVGGHQ